MIPLSSETLLPVLPFLFIILLVGLAVGYCVAMVRLRFGSIPVFILARLFDDSPRATAVTDRRLRYRYANPAARSWDTTPEAMIGKTPWEVFPQEVLKPTLERELRNTLNGEVYEGPLPQFHTTDAVDSRIERRKLRIPIRNTVKQVTGILITVEDIQFAHNLNEKLELQATLLASVRDAVIAQDADRRIFYWNRGAEELYGFTAEEAYGKLPSELHAPGVTSDVAMERRQILDTTDRLYARSVFNHKSGASVQVEAWGYVLRAPDSTLRGFVAINRDLSNHLKIENALQESQHFAEQVVSTVPGIVYVYDVAKRHNIYTNHQIAALLGYSPAQVQAMNSDLIPTLLHPEDVKKLESFVQKRLANNEDAVLRDTEYRLRHANGSWRWFHFRETPFKRAADGTLSQTLGIAQDITEQKLAELELRETEKLLAALYNAVNTGICMIDEQGNFVQANPAYCQMYGFTAEELLGKPYLTVVDPPEHASSWEFHEAFMAGELPDETREVECRRKDGTLFPALLKAALFVREDGRRFRVSALTDITERLQVEEALRKSLKDLAEFKFALDEHCIVWIVNKDSTITYVNDKFCEISKYSRSELIGQHRDIVSSSYHPQSFFDEMRETINRGRVWHGEVKLRAKDGTYFWVDSTVVPFLDDKGKSYQFITIRTDITARKQIEESLRESEERFRTMADNAPVMIWTSDANGHDTFQNKTLTEFTGRPIERNRDLQWLDLIHPEDLSRCIELWEVGFAERKRTSTELRMLRADGTYRWVTDYAVPRFTPDGNFVGFLGTHMDITEQIEAAETLRQMNSELERRVNERTADLQQQRAQLSALLDAMGEGVCYSDYSDGPTIRYVNRALAAMTGYSIDELIGQSGTILFANEPEAQQQAEAMLTAIADIHANRGAVWRGEGKMVRKTGSMFYAALTITAAAESDQDGEGSIHMGAVTIIRDITEEKQLQGHKSLFLANASHELRTPLTNFNTRLYLMRKQPEKISEHQVVLERVCAQMTGLVEDLLDISRFERGILPIDLKQIAVQDIISDVIVIQQPEAQRKHISLTAKLPDQPLYIDADPARLTQVVVNLTINAINYTPENGMVQIGIATEEFESTGFIAIHVCDSGVGIAPEHLEKIFEPFFRATEGSARGTGLGLSIARSIVELHGGSLTVESQPAQGSVFTIRLPIKK